MKIEGKILRIERGAIHDGPGIRTVVFLKGCPLKCLWCSTPESQSAGLELALFKDRCIQCKQCLPVCPEGAIGFTDKEIIQTDRSRCKACGTCVQVCPAGARKLWGQVITVSDLMAEICRDIIFYENSGGGVTLSGGEPLMQLEFVRALLADCRKFNIHTAMETSAYASWEDLSVVMDCLDLIYVDVKHMLDGEHKRLTGKGNRGILNNIQRMSEEGGKAELIIRVPVIPGYNDADENISLTAEFAAGLPQILRIELLPYHQYGLHAYSALSRKYPLVHLSVPEPQQMAILKKKIQSFGITVQIGG